MSVKQNLTYAEIGFCVCFLIFPLFYDKLSGYFFFWFTNIMSDSWHNSNWIKKLLSLSLNICTCMRSHSDPPSDPATFYQLLIMRIFYICMKMLASLCRAAKLQPKEKFWLVTVFCRNVHGQHWLWRFGLYKTSQWTVTCCDPTDLNSSWSSQDTFTIQHKEMTFVHMVNVYVPDDTCAWTKIEVFQRNWRLFMFL